MTDIATLQQALAACFNDKIKDYRKHVGELTIEVTSDDLIEVCRILQAQAEFGFEQLIDVTVVDYLVYGKDEWITDDATASGFSRGTHALDAMADDAPRRFAVVYHLLSVSNNHRLRLKVFTEKAPYIIPTVTSVWAGADWFEREAFDLFGILFDGHPDLRRILTDYGFVGHPLRKDFPTSGHVEVRFDPEQGRVIYQPVSIEPRVLVPKVIRNDHRYTIAASNVGSEEAK